MVGNTRTLSPLDSLRLCCQLSLTGDSSHGNVVVTIAVHDHPPKVGKDGCVVSRELFAFCDDAISISLRIVHPRRPQLELTRGKIPLLVLCNTDNFPTVPLSRT